MEDQQTLFDTDDSPAAMWERDAARRALDDLFSHTRQYKSSADYYELMKFVGAFRFYAPFNAMLVHIQMPGAKFVAPAHRWKREYGRDIKAGARPLVILQPRGPVMFVFDVSDTEPGKNAADLPLGVTDYFAVSGGAIYGELSLTIQNAVRDGVDVAEQQAGSQSAGEIRRVEPGRFLKFQTATRPLPKFAKIPRRYQVLLNAKHSPEAKYATLAHELAHLYCGHLGGPEDSAPRSSRQLSAWPDRTGLSLPVREFEAESVCFLLCSRLGIDNPSARYLSGYLDKNAETPPISLDCVMKAAGLIEQMGREPMKPRKDDS